MACGPTRPFRQLVGAVGVLDQEHEHWLCRLDAPGGAARDHQVVAVAEFQVAEVAVQMPGALVDEQQFVTVTVAHQVAHGAVGLPQAQLDVGVVQRQRCLQRAVAFAGDVIEVEGVRAQRAFPVDPAGRRMLVMQVRSRAEEAFAAHFALVGALRKIAVRLTRSLTSRMGKLIHLRLMCLSYVIPRDLNGEAVVAGA